MEILTIIAILVAPFGALWAYGKIEDRKQHQSRKLHIFKTLMATEITTLLLVVETIAKRGRAASARLFLGVFIDVSY